MSIDSVLDAQQQLSEAQSQYCESLLQHAVAIKNVHLQKGTLLAYNGVHLNEGPWSKKAYRDAAETARRLRPKRIDYRFNYPGVISRGAYPQMEVSSVEEPKVDEAEPLPEPRT